MTEVGGAGRRPGAARPGRGATLRGRVVALLVAVAAVLALAMGTLSAVALRSSLVRSLDDGLVAAARRGEMFGPRGPGAGDGRGPGRGEGGAGPNTDPPGGLVVPGQRVGTLMLVTDGAVTSGAYLDGTATVRMLTEAQAAALMSVRADGRPRSVDVPGLGEFRAVAIARASYTQVTALPLAEVDALTRGFVLTEIAVALVVVGAAVLAGRRLVVRELAPLERVAATAGRVAERPLDRGAVAVPERVAAADLGGTREVAQVGAALNALLDNVEESLAARHASEMQVRRFVADASHELRTPLSSVRGYAELVRRRETALPDDAAHALTRIESEARRMTALVEDMLLLARLDAGRELRREEVDVAVLAVDATSDAHAAGSGHRFLLDLPEVVDAEVVDDGVDAEAPVVIGDEDRLRQVLANLLTNARVHTPAGTTVRVAVRRVAGGGGGAGAGGGDRVVVSVADDGPGIDADLLPRLFDRFSRGDSARTRAGAGGPESRGAPAGGTGSTGLGLSIVRAVVQAHGGEVAVASSQAGTVFTVDLPAAPAA